MPHALRAVLVLLVSGCVPDASPGPTTPAPRTEPSTEPAVLRDDPAAGMPGSSKNPKTIGGVFDALATMPAKSSFLGKLPRDLTAPLDSDGDPPMSAPYPINVDFGQLVWQGADAEHVCVLDISYRYKRVSLKTKPAELIAETRARYELAGVAVDTIESVADVRERPLWPPADRAKKIDLIEVASDSVEPVEDDDGTITQKRMVKLKVCAPRPKITSKTRFIVFHFDGKSARETSMVKGPSLMVFALTDGGKVDLVK